MKLKPNQNQRANSQDYVCYCNKVSKEVIESAIRKGCDTLPRIFDATQAGVGACGGSCRPYLLRMLESYKRTGEFPLTPRPKRTKRRNPV